MKISEGERKVLSVVWDEEGITAAQIADCLGGKNGWSKTTTYTMISVCIEKGLLRREDPKYHCYSLISREEASLQDAEELIDSRFGGSADLLVAALVGRKRLTKEQIEKLYKLAQSVDD